MVLGEKYESSDDVVGRIIRSYFIYFSGLRADYGSETQSGAAA